MTNDINIIFDDFKYLVEGELTKSLSKYLKLAPSVLKNAIEYSVLGNGKRIRALIVYGIGEIFGATHEQLCAPASAVELIHAYSLIHDDLPAMDNSPLRRGKPACHIVYGDAIAILAGDTLQALAFEILSQALLTSHTQRLMMIATLTHACGATGMVAGQVLDISATGKQITIEALTKLHRLKTGKLIEASATLGAIAGNASDEAISHTKNFAAHLGLAFQIQDDLLDAKSDKKQLGKPCSDQDNHKNTYTSLLGIADAEQKLQSEIALAHDALSQVAPPEHWLHELIDFVAKREY